MTHTELLAQLSSLVAQAGDGLEWVGFGRVLETMVHLAEKSKVGEVSELASPLAELLRHNWEDRPFSMIDYHDHRPQSELMSAYCSTCTEG